ncbi:MAG: phage integrase SAM-like domain-containing protein [Saprospiraceae bacterium]|nr:phage integrase SAM-like domain-containing protein [Saprospiraceae bacterium]
MGNKFETHLIKIGNEPGTIWTRKKVLKTILNKAVEENYLRENPLIGMKNKKSSKVPQYLSLEEFKTFLVNTIPLQKKLKVLPKTYTAWCVYRVEVLDIFFRMTLNYFRRYRLL